MTGPSATRLLARAGFRQILRPSVAPRCTSFAASRPFSLSAPTLADEPPKSTTSTLSSLYSAAPTEPKAAGATGGSTAGSMMDILGETLGTQGGGAGAGGRQSVADFGELTSDAPDAIEPYHFHIYSHKHNTHVTVSKPDRGAIISMSTGNIGFRKQRRKTYDAAYQLTAYVLERLKYAGWESKINRMELVLRGFGQGREAGVKVLMAPEGTVWRQKIVKVADGTRVKFGGTRSKGPKRL